MKDQNPKFPDLKTTGRMFSRSEIDGFIKDHTDPTRTYEEFGKDVLMKLLTMPGCEGLRVYYGQASETEANGPTQPSRISAKGTKKGKRLFFVPIDQNYKEIEFALTTDGLKDDGGGRGAGDGIPCPPFGRP